MNKARVRELVGKTKTTLKNEGTLGLIKKAGKFIIYKISAKTRKYDREFKLLI